MNKDRTRRLIEAGPTLYGGRTLPIRQNHIAFRFECRDGWFVPLMKLTQQIEEEIARMRASGTAECELPMAVQVKEKYGGLRFYMGITSDAIEKLIKMAERECSRTCEVCGAPGKTRDDEWVETLCDGCFGQK